VVVNGGVTRDDPRLIQLVVRHPLSDLLLVVIKVLLNDDPLPEILRKVCNIQNLRSVEGGVLRKHTLCLIELILHQLVVRLQTSLLVFSIHRMLALDLS